MKKYFFIPLGLVFILIFCESCSPANRKNRVKHYFELGNENLQNGNFSEAISWYDKALEKDSNVADAYMNRGVAYFSINKFAMALADYNQVYRLQPDYHDVLFNRVYAYWKLGRFKSALEDLEQLHKIYPDTALVSVVEALIHHDLNNDSLAIIKFNEAIALDDVNFDAYSNRGIVYYKNKKYLKAEKDLKKALLLYENEANTLNALALNYMEQEKLNLADSLLALGLESDKYNAYMINNKGLVALKKGNLKLADSLFRTSQLLDDKNAWVYRNRAYWALEKNNIDMAKQFVKSAIELDSSLVLSDPKLSVFLK